MTSDELRAAARRLMTPTSDETEFRAWDDAKAIATAWLLDNPTPPTDPPREASDQLRAAAERIVKSKPPECEHIFNCHGQCQWCKWERSHLDAFALADDYLRAASVPPLPTAADVEALAKNYACGKTHTVCHTYEGIYDGLKAAYLAGARSEAERMAAEVKRLQSEADEYQRLSQQNYKDCERLAAELRQVREAREALKPFAEIKDNRFYTITVGDCRKAAAAVATAGQEGK